MKLLVTGGCGFLGSNLARAALERGLELTVFDNLSRLGSAANLSWLQSAGTFRFVHGDVRNANDVERVVQETRPDRVFHLAGQVAMTTSLANPRLDFEINARGSFLLLDSVRKYAPEAVVIYSSTNKVYGDLEGMKYRETSTRYELVDRPEGLDENTPLTPTTPYGVSKCAADTYMQDYCRMFGVRTVVFRHSSMYGGRQFATFDQGWVGWFCQKAIEAADGVRESFTISGNGKQVRDVLHGEDMVRLYFAASERAETVAGQVFNVGGGMANSLSLLELFRLLERVVGAKLDYRPIAARKSDQKVFVADVTKAQRLLDWRPAVSAEDGIRRMVEWTRMNAAVSSAG